MFNGVDNIPDKAPPAEENEAEAHVEEQDGVDSIPDKAPPAEETGAEALVEEQDGVEDISEKAPPVEETGAEASVEEREASEEQQNAKPKCKGGRKRKRAAGSEDIDSTSVFQKLLVVKRSEADLTAAIEEERFLDAVSINSELLEARQDMLRKGVCDICLLLS